MNESKLFGWRVGVLAVVVGMPGCGEEPKNSRGLPDGLEPVVAAKEKASATKAESKTEEPAGKTAADVKAAPVPDATDALMDAITAYNEGRLDDALARVAEDVELIYVGAPTPIIGKAAIKESWEQVRKAFPDSAMKARRLVVSEDVIAAHLVLTGTHKGEFAGAPGTDKPIATDAFMLFKYRGGRLIRLTQYSNPAAIGSQIGVALPGMPIVPLSEPAPAQPEIIKAGASEENLDLVTRWFASFGAGTSVTDIEQYLSKVPKHHAMAEAEHTEGLEAAKASIAEVMTAVSDTKIVGTNYWSSGDYVVVTGEWSGRHTGDLGPIKATDREFKVEFAEVMRMEDGRIAETWSFGNPLQLLGQLGVMPEAPAPTLAAK